MPSTTELATQAEVATSTGSHSTATRKGKRRNKPTLNCKLCVERKTKCDRGRPSCEPCYVRGLECEYSWVADYMASNGHYRRRPRQSTVDIDLPSHEWSIDVATSFAPSEHCNLSDSMIEVESDWPLPGSARPALNLDDTHTSRNAFLEELGNAPKSDSKDSGYPFANYWTCTGGIEEVIAFLPSRDTANRLEEIYFQTVDPVYPFLSRHAFEADSRRFWNMSFPEKCETRADHLALRLMVYACAAQHLDDSDSNRKTTAAEFYASASHRSLCVFSYLSRASLMTIQTLTLMCHFLVNSNRISAGWTFSGITQRQAYSLSLHRPLDLSGHCAEAGDSDPVNVFQHDSEDITTEQRYRMWQAIMTQDTSMALYCKLPPATSHHDMETPFAEYVRGFYKTWEPVQEPGSTVPKPSAPGVAVFSSDDIPYLLCMWQCTLFAQERICIRQSLGHSLFRSPSDKTSLLRDLRRMREDWPAPFSSVRADFFQKLDERLSRQVVAVSSHYFWLLGRLCMRENKAAAVLPDYTGALGAAHEGLAAFFTLLRLGESRANMWCAHHTRAYDQVVTIGRVLSMNSSVDNPNHLLAKSDFERYTDILLRARGNADFEHKRMSRLEQLNSLRLAM